MWTVLFDHFFEGAQQDFTFPITFDSFQRKSFLKSAIDRINFLAKSQREQILETSWWDYLLERRERKGDSADMIRVIEKLDATVVSKGMHLAIP